ncbi:Ig-like domain-containing protein [Neobacillus sp. PS3-34]|uniref:Ig-like domain-containing protein n=1 Tax=Neobacillus sp. PS3-34 TaxID=3070678 RepID=UPI0027E12839|nr:Ig-like domain-containing protein [Neobacillus sp. PS3-34]WML50415.1 Ig-like domain-containing protein [Neobacillus sp. PS3-34]
MGVVRGRVAGTAVITETVTTNDNFVLYTTVPVEVKVNTVTLNANGATLKRSKTRFISVKSASDKIKSVTYASSNKRYATVDSKGRVKAVRYGKATITASYKTQGGYVVIKKFAVTIKK